MKFLTIGSVAVDLYLRTNKTSFNSGSKNLADERFTYIGGGAYNTARLFSNFHYPTEIASCIGNDYYGGLAWQAIRREKKVSSRLIQRSNTPTSLSVILLDPKNEKTSICQETFHDNYRFSPSIWQKRSLICMSSVGGREDILESALDFKKKNPGVFLAGNPGQLDFPFLRRNDNLLSLYNVLTMNQDEAMALSREKTPLKAMQFFMERVGGVFVMTTGPEGCVVSYGGKIFKHGTYPTEIEDRNGAGDAFFAGFVMSFALYSNIDFALKTATLNAEEVISARGASENALTPQRYEELRKMRASLKY
jgi:sugar/nucleoside kinase (ribokinase family)